MDMSELSKNDINQFGRELERGRGRERERQRKREAEREMARRRVGEKQRS